MPRRPPRVEGFVFKSLRESLGLTQAEAGLKVGLSADQINSLERGDSLTPERLRELALKLDEDFSASLAQGMAGTLGGLFPGSEEAPPLELTRQERLAAAAIGLGLGAVAVAVIRKHRLEERVRHDREAAVRQWEEVRGCTAEEWQTLLEKDPGFATWSMVERLCEESCRAAPAKPSRALFLARQAVAVGDRVEGGPAWRACLLGYAWAFVGNALRVGNDLHGADEAFGRAWEIWASGTAVRPIPLDESRLYDLTASLRRDQGHMTEALAFLDQALAASKTLAMEGHIFLNKAFTLEQMGDAHGAWQALRKAADRVDEEKEPRQAFGIWFNLANVLCRLRRFDEAERLVGPVRQRAIKLAGYFDLARALWLEAKVDAGLGRAEQAEIKLKQVAR